ncbi:hypothetical protein E2C01_049723 [Portunus trituberculatus]|uniref:Uncharacterized protein n=1 Tax=Portunus trituberculatus TaxID=210409 RepID=A0A5B7GEK4_PORTR|nr:hypothetical protein [Portunus trituberculatus]
MNGRSVGGLVVAGVLPRGAGVFEECDPPCRRGAAATLTAGLGGAGQRPSAGACMNCSISSVCPRGSSGLSLPSRPAGGAVSTPHRHAGRILGLVGYSGFLREEH